jgi:Protein of unknown function (DUF1353)
MPFETDLVAKQVGDFDWRLIQDLSYRDDTGVFRVPTGSDTDFASVPLSLQ